MGSKKRARYVIYVQGGNILTDEDTFEASWSYAREKWSESPHRTYHIATVVNGVARETTIFEPSEEDKLRLTEKRLS